MPFLWIPDVHRCCYCITNLKTATTIIAVLGIVTSPLISWAFVRHAYVIRVSCYVSTNESKPDVIDVNLHNVLSFGFGANAGLGPSCLHKPSVESIPSPKTTFKFAADRVGGDGNQKLLKIIMYVGWVVLLGDLVFVVCCIIFLFKLAKEQEDTFLKVLIWTCIVATILTFLYGLMFVITCLITSQKFPVCEFIFTIFDLCIWCMWVYYIIVLNSYLHSYDKPIEKEDPNQSGTNNPTVNFDFWAWYSSRQVWIYFLIVVNSYRRAGTRTEINQPMNYSANPNITISRI